MNPKYCGFLVLPVLVLMSWASPAAVADEYCGQDCTCLDLECFEDDTDCVCLDCECDSSQLDGDLTVILSSPVVHALTAQWVTLTANISGGDGPCEYKWLHRWCENSQAPDACPINYLLLGESGSTLTKYIQTYHNRNDFVVEVKCGTKSGASMHMITGPAEPELTNIPANPGAQCTLTTSFYPFTDSDGRNYRRNPCFGNKEYQP